MNIRQGAVLMVSLRLAATVIAWNFNVTHMVKRDIFKIEMVTLNCLGSDNEH